MPLHFHYFLKGELEGLPPQKIHCSILAEEAIKAAIEDYQNRKNGKKSSEEIPMV